MKEKKWTKEQWRDWGKRKKERDERRRLMEEGKLAYGVHVERMGYWNEYREAQVKEVTNE